MLNIAIAVLDTSNVHQDDIGNYLGFYIFMRFSRAGCGAGLLVVQLQVSNSQVDGSLQYIPYKLLSIFRIVGPC